MKLHALLNKIYFDIKSVGSFGGVDLLWREVKRRSGCKKAKRDFIVQWLARNPTYTCFKPARVNFPRAPIVIDGPDVQWQTDLVDVSSIKEQNDGNTFLLTVIDAFSRQAWIEPIKSKSAQDVLTGFEKIYGRANRKIKLLQSDQGTF